MNKCHGILGPQNGSDVPSALGLVIRMPQNLASLFAYRAMRSCSSFLPPWGSNLPGCARASWDRIPWSGCWRGAAVCGRVRLYCCLQICSRQLDIVHYPFTTQNLLVSPSRKKRGSCQSPRVAQAVRSRDCGRHMPAI